MQQCKANCDLRRCLRDWYTSPLGRQLEAVERAALDDLLPGLFGYHLLQVGASCTTPLAGQSPIHHRVVIDDDPTAPSCAVAAGATQLPVASDSVDVVLLHHALEFAADPRQALREVERVLIPEGVVVIVGFNPYSSWGARGWVRRRQGDAPWCGHFLSQPRLRDWLALLGFDTLHNRNLFYRPPLRRPGLLRRTALLESWGTRWWRPFGGIYVVVARKRVATLTPIKPRWRNRARLVSSGLVEPTSRSGTGG
jgi:SAM-dependent methyltransferase